MWLARLLAWLSGVWSFGSPRRTARLLHGFACTEQQSQLELREAARRCPDDRRQGLYLRHALDEARHARAFAEQAAELSRASGGAALARAAADSERLYERHGEARFLGLVARGERRGRVEFEVYAGLLRRRGQLSLAELFEGLVRDERQHEAYTAQRLDELCGSAGARRAWRYAARSEAWRAFRDRGRRFAGALYGVAMFVLYLALAPYALAFRALHGRRSGFSSEP